MTLSSSPNRNTFQRDKYIDRRQELGMMDNPDTQDMLKYYESIINMKEELELDPNWSIDNLEYDLRTTDWILEKVRISDSYAKDLYAAMCNNEFIKNEVFPILKGKTWCCSWRYAGGIIADMRQEGDYIDWYCSGNESVVTDEIKKDLLRLGWIIKNG